MAKFSQSEIKAKADEWAGFGKKIEKAEAARNAELDPLIKKHAAAMQPILDRHDPKIEKLRNQRAAIETEVIGWLNRAGKPLVLEGELAEAANETKVGSRVIDVQKFFDKAREKNAEFWGCVSVAIAKAEKLLGKTAVDEISTRETKLVASLRIK